LGSPGVRCACNAAWPLWRGDHWARTPDRMVEGMEASVGGRRADGEGELEGGEREEAGVVAWLGAGIRVGRGGHGW